MVEQDWNRKWEICQLPSNELGKEILKWMKEIKDTLVLKDGSETEYTQESIDDGFAGYHPACSALYEYNEPIFRYSVDVVGRYGLPIGIVKTIDALVSGKVPEDTN